MANQSSNSNRTTVDNNNKTTFGISLVTKYNGCAIGTESCSVIVTYTTSASFKLNSYKYKSSTSSTDGSVCSSYNPSNSSALGIYIQHNDMGFLVNMAQPAAYATMLGFDGNGYAILNQLQTKW